VDDYVLTLKTLADPTRLKIFKLVVTEELCGCELQELLQVSQPAISQHMAKLRQAGLVKERRSGMWTYYRGDLERVKAQLGEFLGFLAADPNTLPALADIMERRGRLNRAEMCCDDRKGECKG
jgi:ArsR family transcriptional regulator, arsenate/arsenite/antimonite-responsive transcriptional repressor